MKKLTLIGGSGVLGLALGLLINGGAKPSTFIIAGAMSAFSGGLTMVVADTKNQGKINQFERKLSDKDSENHKLSLLVSAISEEKAELAQKLGLLKQELEQVRLELADKTLSESAKLSEVNRLNQMVSDFAIKTAGLEEEVSRLKDENEAMEDCFQEAVEDAANKRFQQALTAEIKKNRDDCVAILQEAFEISSGYRKLTKDIYTRHQEQRENIFDINAQFNEHINECQRSFSDERDNYLSQIDLLNMKVAALQQKLEGDLLQPEYGHFGYQWDARISDDIARKCWDMLKIPLAVKGYKINPDGSAEGGYAYSRSTPVEALVRDLSRYSGDIAKALGIHAVTSIKKHELSDLLIIQWRCERPKPLKDEEIYRILKPSGVSLRIIREATDHKKGGKPTLRIMGSTGEGKGIIARALLADWVKSEAGEVWLSDPMDGSEEDRWECPKVAKSASEARGILKQFAQEFSNRKNKVSTRKDTHILALFDEFDKEHPKDDKELVKGIWTAIRHHKMRLILMGQSSEVGVNGWQWDEMKNCACLFVGSGISTAIKHAKDLGLSRATANQLEVQKDQITNWLESKNQGLDAGSQYRVALLIIGEKAQFLELPMAYEGEIQNDKSAIVSHPWQSLNDEVKPTIAESRVCPGCGGKLRKAGSKLRCENPAHAKAMGKKTFSLND